MKNAGMATSPVARLDDYVLQMFFYGMIAGLAKKYTEEAITTFAGYFPSSLWDELFTKCYGLVKNLRANSDKQKNKMIEEYCKKALPKDLRWKSMVIKRMIKIANVNGKPLDKQLSAIATLSEKIDAKKECSQQFLKEFGYDPLSRKATSAGVGKKKGDQLPTWNNVWYNEALKQGGIHVNLIDDFNARGLRCLYGAEEIFPNYPRLNMSIWMDRQKRLLVRFWSRGKYVEGKTFEVIGVKPELISSLKAKDESADGWIPQRLRDAYDDWIRHNLYNT